MQQEDAASESARAGRKEWIGLAVIALPCILYSMDLTVLNLALPHLSRDLAPSSSELLWIIDIYGFLVAGFLITMGTLGDRIGRRKLLMIGAGAFGLASLLAAYASSAGMLIAARAILGVAGATLAPSTLSLIRNMFLDPKQRTIAIGIWITSYSAGGAMGPLIGGVLLEYFWWGSVFLISVPVMVLLLLLAPFLLPEYKNPGVGKPDLVSTLLSLAAVLLVIFGLKKIAESGAGWLPFTIMFLGILLGIVFIKRQTRLPDPMIDLRLFHNRAFSISLLIYTLGTFMAFGAFLYTFQYMQLIAGLTPLKAGLWSLPTFFAFIIGSMLTPALAQKLRPANIMSCSLFLAAAGFLILTQIRSESNILLLIGSSFVYCLGIAPVFTLTTDLIVGAAPPEKAGAASALSETGSEFGGAVGIAVLGSIGTAIYRSNLDAHMPQGIAEATAQAARETLGGAAVQATQLPPGLGNALLSAAKEAFIAGMQTAALISGCVAIMLAILCSTMLRRVSQAP